jgi:hypothetical protein
MIRERLFGAGHTLGNCKDHSAMLQRSRFAITSATDLTPPTASTTKGDRYTIT